MPYKSLEECLLDLERTGQLLRVSETVDPHLQMAAIHLRVFEAGGPALLFEKVAGTRFRAASNIFGNIERSRYIFRDSLQTVQQLIALKNDPMEAFRHPFKNMQAGFRALQSFPQKNASGKPVLQQQVQVSDLPLVTHWPKDGGAFITLPQVYTEDPEHPGIGHSNLGMYRIQLTGNDYKLNEELGLHYQLHRGIGIHQSKSNKAGKPLKVSIFIGGPPAHSVAAVMPLPEGISEMRFAGVLGNRRFRYRYVDGYCVSTDADFVITGEVYPNENKPEGPFGDHLGYYSLEHPFPVMRVHKIYARNNAIWPFTVVGRPPQEDTAFGQLIHELTGEAIQQEIPGLKEVHAVDAAGVHPLLLAIGSERYTPYQQTRQPAELLTIANHILGTGQLSLAKFLFITADQSNQLRADKVEPFLEYMLQRLNLQRDIHFYTKTTIDTLDYSGDALNSGSKVVLAAYGEVLRELGTDVPPCMKQLSGFTNPVPAMKGVLVLQANKFANYAAAAGELKMLNDQLKKYITELHGFPILILADESNFTSASIINFLWVSFTRCNPSHDIYGVDEFTEFKHWGCRGPLILDARIKPHHAPVLEKDPAVEKSIDPLFEKGGSLYGVLK